jgi:hypothetical protein
LDKNIFFEVFFYREVLVSAATEVGMRFFLIFFFIFSVFGFSTFAHAELAFKGVNFEPFRDSSTLSYGTPNSLNSISKLTAFNVNTVGIRQYAWVKEFDSVHVEEGTLPGRNYDQLKIQIQQLKSLNLKTYFTFGLEVLDSQMGMPNSPQDWLAWHGAIDLGTPTDIDLWFSEYGGILKKYARLANEMHVEVFSIANELVSLSSTEKLKALNNDLTWLYAYPHTGRFGKYSETCLRHLISFKEAFAPEKNDRAVSTALLEWYFLRDGHSPLPQQFQNFILKSENLRRSYLEKKWRRLISEVSVIYKDHFTQGVLTMNANHDHVYHVSFWDALDQISISTYFNLTGSDSHGIPLAGPTGSFYLALGWENILEQLDLFFTQMQKKAQKPVVFSELGYTDRTFSAAVPWASTGVYKIKLQNGLTVDQDFADRVIDQSERANALEALSLLIRIKHAPWLNGILLWDVYPLGRLKMDQFQLFTDLNDPTNQIVKELFQTSNGSL